MTVTQRGDLTAEDSQRIGEAVALWQRTEALRENVRAACVEVMARSSIRAVSKATGFSTNTLQRWKREAGK